MRKKKDPNIYRCDNCNKLVTREQLQDVGELDSDYLYPETCIPWGRCPSPDCGAGCYPIFMDLGPKGLALFYRLSTAMARTANNYVHNAKERRALRKDLAHSLTLLSKVCADVPKEYL